VLLVANDKYDTAERLPRPAQCDRQSWRSRRRIRGRGPTCPQVGHSASGVGPISSRARRAARMWSIASASSARVSAWASCIRARSRAVIGAGRQRRDGRPRVRRRQAGARSASRSNTDGRPGGRARGGARAGRSRYDRGRWAFQRRVRRGSCSGTSERGPAWQRRSGLFADDARAR